MGSGLGFASGTSAMVQDSLCLHSTALAPTKSPALGGDFWLTLRCGVAGGRGRFDPWAWEPIELHTPDM